VARQADSASPTGALHGIPVGIKDVIDTVDMPTAYGSPIYEGHRPAADAAAVGAIRDAGGIILGKTVTCEFAGGLPSRTRNPRDLGHTPGGSSSGSAAAVAAGMIPVALGTQTAGSIIRPASFCGVVGYKPTYGYVNRAGMKPLAESVDTIGLFANRVDDAGWFAAALMSRPELADDAPLPKPPRILVCRTDKWPDAAEDGHHALEAAIRRLERRGATIIESALPFSVSDLSAAGLTIIATDARRSFAHELRCAPDLLSANMRGFLDRGEIGTCERYDAAQCTLREARAAFDVLLDSGDAVLTLSAPGEAPKGLETTGSAIFNFIWTLLHGPCISVPGLTGSHGLPIGIQIIGRRFGDARLLTIGRWLEQVLGSP
jgi:amidase